MNIFADKKKLQEALDAANASVTALTAERDEAKAALKEVSGNLETANASIAKLNADLAAQETVAAKATADLAAARAELDAEKAKNKTVADEAADIATAQVASVGFPADKLPADPASHSADTLDSVRAQISTETDPTRKWDLAKKAAALRYQK